MLQHCKKYGIVPYGYMVSSGSSWHISRPMSTEPLFCRQATEYVQYITCRLHVRGNVQLFRCCSTLDRIVEIANQEPRRPSPASYCTSSQVLQYGARFLRSPPSCWTAPVPTGPLASFPPRPKVQVDPARTANAQVGPESVGRWSHSLQFGSIRFVEIAAWRRTSTVAGRPTI